jgi:hypothetical protein
LTHAKKALASAPLDTIEVPFTPTTPLQKGIAHLPSTGAALSEADRVALLTAIARSKAWVEAILKDHALDFATIARRENRAERHVRFLAPLAYLSPRVIKAIAEGRAPGNLNVSNLARALPRNWADQEQRFGMR